MDVLSLRVHASALPCNTESMTWVTNGRLTPHGLFYHGLWVGGWSKWRRRQQMSGF